jgi:hypothetical protein
MASRQAVSTLRGSKNSRTTFWNIDDWEEHVLAHRPDGSSRGSSNWFSHLLFWIGRRILWKRRPWIESCELLPAF